ncbi:MAG TPA: hypothetical protein VMW55_08130 [Nitrosopumilaceae archaeon]|nr:hypothetical protein [Nitrosopumilaceae archaeon]
MKTQVTLDQKLADWESVFYSMSNSQNKESLKGLIADLRTKMGISIPGVA